MKKSVLELLMEEYNVIREFKKLNKLLFEAKIFKEYSYCNYITYEQYFDKYVLRKWLHRKTFEDFQEMKQSLKLPNELESFSKENFVDYLELLYNVFYISPYSYDYTLTDISEFDENSIQFANEIMSSLIANLHLKVKKDKDGWNIIYEDNDCLDSAIQDLSPEAQIETIKYLKIQKDDLTQKRKQLAFLATEHYIEQNKTGYEPLDTLLKDCTGLLNNLHIRHNNITGKWESEIVKNMSKKDAIELCDIIYDKILIVLMLRKDFQKKDKVKKLNEGLKKEKTND